MELNTNLTNETLDNMYDYMNNVFLNPTIFIIILAITVAYLLFFSTLGKNNLNTNSMGTDIASFSSSTLNSTSATVSSSTGKTIGLIIAGVIIFFLLINVVKYFLQVDIIASLKNVFTNKPEIDIIVDQGRLHPSTVPKIRLKKQVFNIPGNTYSYADAKSLCSAYNSKLATYKQIEDAYKNGAEWCNYGWSDGQLALFPTQQKTYDGLQEIEGHEHDCGRPGINGGYMSNDKIKYGVNCYGYKPKITEESREIMDSTTPFPKTYKDIAMEKRVEYWKDKLDEILVSPFNYDSWSRL
jgi:hypothetical protein